MCRANNSVGAGSFCELTVDGKHFYLGSTVTTESMLFDIFFLGKLLWYQNLLPLTPLILVAVLLICLIGVVTLIIIIICACRRQRKRSSKSNFFSNIQCYFLFLNCVTIMYSKFLSI